MSATSLTRNGLRDWLIQRFSAVYMAVYVACLVFCMMKQSPLSYRDWHAMFSSDWAKITTVIFIISLAWHAWIGVWTVLTDYVKCSRIRLTLYAAMLVALLAYVIWTIQILWGA